MLSYLVKSKARRRLLSLLWVDRATGTATQLAARARVSFASAYRELQAMKRHGLVTSVATEAGEVFAARENTPEFDLLHRLASSRPQTTVDPEVRELRAHLAAAGAPLHADPTSAPSPAVSTLVARALVLARRDPDVARSLPVLLFRALDANTTTVDELSAEASTLGVGHLLGFFLALTGRLAHDPRLTKAANELRDHRVKNQELFSSRTGTTRSPPFPLARSWGLQMRADEPWFRDLFRKYVSPEAQ